MDDRNDQKNILIPATYRLLAVTLLSSIIYTILFNVYSTPFTIHAFQPGIIFFLHFTLLIYLYKNPIRRVHRVINAYGAVMLFTTVPNTLYFTISAWQGDWRFVDTFPPFSGMIILTTTLMMLMLPEKYNKLAVITLILNAFPVLLFLLTHQEELQTPRGYDLLFLFGPASLLILLIVPYQRGINNHMNKIVFDLQHSQQAAERDFLTDVYNRRGFEGWLNNVNPSTKACVLLMDIDHFKTVNDRFGHSIGDRVLIEFASRLRTVYQGKYGLARWGGEEFLIVILNPKTNKTNLIAELFRSAINQLPYKDVGKVTASIGVSHINEIKHFSTMVEEADKAVYFGKDNGRDQVALYRDILEKRQDNAD